MLQAPPDSLSGSPRTAHLLLPGYEEVAGQTNVASSFDELPPSITTVTAYTDTFHPVQDSEQISIRPPLEDNFSTGRVIAGALSVKSDATSTTSAAMSGTLSAGVLSDTRDVPGFSPPSLAQQSITKKDGIINARIQDGVVSILGSDIPNNFQPIDLQDTYGPGEAGFEKVFHVFKNFTTGNDTVNSGGVWISPYYSMPEMPASQNVKIDPIGLTDNMTIRAGFPHAALGSPDVSGGFITNYYAQFVNGALKITQDTDNNGRWLFAPVSAQSGVQNDNLELNWIEFHTHHASNKMWIGAYVEANSVTTITGVSYTIMVSPERLYNQGNLQARAIRWDNVATGQNIIVSGRVVVEAVASGELAPYVSSANSLAAYDANLLPLVSQLFNGPSKHFRRNWVGVEYAKMLNDWLPGLTAEKIIEELHDSPDETKAAAAGLFGSLLKRAHGALGAINRGLGTAHAITDAATNIAAPFVDSVGSSGKFQGMHPHNNDLTASASADWLAAIPGIGPAALAVDALAGDSAGMFGDSAGMFGDSAGMFGSGNADESGDASALFMVRDPSAARGFALTSGRVPGTLPGTFMTVPGYMNLAKMKGFKNRIDTNTYIFTLSDGDGMTYHVAFSPAGVKQGESFSPNEAMNHLKHFFDTQTRSLNDQIESARNASVKARLRDRLALFQGAMNVVHDVFTLLTQNGSVDALTNALGPLLPPGVHVTSYISPGQDRPKSHRSTGANVFTNPTGKRRRDEDKPGI